jgi:hypothetical protein
VTAVTSVIVHLQIIRQKIHTCHSHETNIIGWNSASCPQITPGENQHFNKTTKLSWNITNKTSIFKVQCSIVCWSLPHTKLHLSYCQKTLYTSQEMYAQRNNSVVFTPSLPLRFLFHKCQPLMLNYKLHKTGKVGKQKDARMDGHKIW